MSGKITRGIITADATVVSPEVSTCKITLKRAGVAVAGTFGADAYTDQGDLMKECTLTNRTGKTGATGSLLGNILYDAVLAGENVEITAVLQPGVVSVTNPRYVFTISPLEASKGGDVGSVPTDSITHSIVGDIVIETAP